MDAYNAFSTSLSSNDQDFQNSSERRHSETKLLIEVMKTVEELESFLFVLESQVDVLKQIMAAYFKIYGGHDTSIGAMAVLDMTCEDIKRITTNVKRLVKNASQLQTAVSDGQSRIWHNLIE